jgi:hypothetical protein
MHHIPILHHILLPLQPQLPRRLHPRLALVLLEILDRVKTSALMKPRSKSEWITPAACGAVQPLPIVQARISFSPAVK